MEKSWDFIPQFLYEPCCLTPLVYPPPMSAPYPCYPYPCLSPTLFNPPCQLSIPTLVYPHPCLSSTHVYRPQPCLPPPLSVLYPCLSPPLSIPHPCLSPTIDYTPPLSFESALLAGLCILQVLLKQTLNCCSPLSIPDTHISSTLFLPSCP